MQILRAAAVAMAGFLLCPAAGWGQAPKGGPAVVAAEPPDAERTKEQLTRVLGQYPPSLARVLAIDPTLLTNRTYLEPYPGLGAFLDAHPEIAHNPGFFLGDGGSYPRDRDTRILDFWERTMDGATAFAAFCLGAGVLIWLIRTVMDYRRWSRLAKVQMDAHTKLIDRFTANEELLNYMQSPAGLKFLQSSPIAVDPAPRSLGSPLGRILWSVQGGIVLLAGGIGLQFVSGRVAAPEAAQPLHALGVLGVALGLGFVVSAAVSFAISQRLGLVEQPRA